MTILEEITDSAAKPLADAYSLPFEAYTDAEVCAAESRHIFAKEWVFMCMAGELPNPGDYYATTLAREPIIIMRSADGELRGLSNICRHRGTLMLDEGFGSIDKYIICPYHAWAYDTEGALQAIPYNDVIAVDRADHALGSFPVSSWCGLVFANLDPQAVPLETRLAGIDQYLQLLAPHTFQYVSSGPVETWAANWKLAMENAMESYHLFKVHERTLEPFSPTRDAYYMAGCTEWSLTGGATERKQGLVEKLFSGGYHELYEHYVLVALPPSFVGVLTYGSFGWLSAHPIDESNSRIRSGSTLAKPTKREAGSQDEFTAKFFQEDKEICERVQRGMSATLGRGGKLVDMEQVVVDFHQFLASRLSNAPKTEMVEAEAGVKWRTAKDK